MIRYELSKILRGRLTVVLILSLLLINGVGGWRLSVPGVASYTNMEVSHILSLYKALPDNGEDTLSALEGKQETLSQAMWNETDPGGHLTGDLYSEIQLFEVLRERTEPVVKYPTILQEIEDNAQTLLLTGRYEEGSFAHKTVQRTREQYGRLSYVAPVILYSGAIELLPGGGITEIMAVLMALLIALELVYSERERGTMALCKPTCRGSLSLIMVKVVAGLLLITIGTILLYGSNLTIGFLRCGWVDLSAPIQSVYGMIRSPWKITIGEYIVLFFVIKILWSASVMVLAYVASYVGNRLWQCLVLFLFAGGICYFPSDSVLNPYTTGKVTELFGNYRNLNVFGLPISNLAASVWGMVILLLVGWGSAVYLHCRLAPGISERNRKKRQMKLPKIGILFTYEGRKLLFMNGGIYIMVALLVVQILVYSDYPHDISPQEQMYIRYSEILAGMANTEKDEYIQQEEERFAELYCRLEEYSQYFAQGQISEESYSVLTVGVQRQLSAESSFHRARDQYFSMKEKDLEYVCLTPYNRLLGNQGKRELLRQSIWLILALSVGLSGAVAMEHETGVIALLHTVEREKESQRNKRAIAVLYGLSGALIVYVPVIVAVWLSYGLPGLTATAGSVPSLGLTMGQVWSVLGLYGLSLGVFSVGIALTILLISKLTCNSVHTCLYSGALFATPCIVGLLALHVDGFFV